MKDNRLSAKAELEKNKGFLVESQFEAASFCMQDNTLFILSKTGEVQKFKKSTRFSACETPNYWLNTLSEENQNYLKIQVPASLNGHWSTITAFSYHTPVICSMFDEENNSNYLFIIDYSIAPSPFPQYIQLKAQPSPIHRSIIIQVGRRFIMLCVNYYSTMSIVNLREKRATLVKHNIRISNDHIHGLTQSGGSVFVYGSNKCLHTIVFSTN